METLTTELEAEHEGLLADTERYQQLAAQQRQHLSVLENKLSELQARVVEQRGVRVAEQKTTRLRRKHIRMLENRLEQSTWKLNRLFSENLALREDLTHLLGPRNMFCRTYKKLNLELERQHHVTNELVEKSVLAYKQRSENLRHVVMVKERNKRRESQAHEISMEQRRGMEHEAKQTAFMAQKEPCTASFREDEESPQEATRPAASDGMDDDDNLETLTKVAGERDPQVRPDEEEFAVFLFVGQLNSKINHANRRMKELQTDILNFELDDRRREEQCDKQLKDMKSRLEGRRALAASLRQQHTAVRRALDRQKGAVSELFAGMNCDPAPIAGKLGCSAHVTDDNVTQFIGVLEDHAHGLLVKVSLQGIQPADDRDDDEEAPANLLLTSCALPPPPATFCAHMLAPCEAPPPESDLLMDRSGLRQHVLLHVLELEQSSSPRAPSAGENSQHVLLHVTEQEPSSSLRAPSAGQKGKRTVPHSSTRA